MLRNYIKIAIRNFGKYKIYSSINVFGLSIGLTCALLIGLYIRYEWSYDRFHPEVEQVYRVNSKMYWTEDPTYGITSSDYLAEQIRAELQEEVKTAAVFRRFRSNVRPAQTASDVFFDQNLYIIEPEIFDIFAFEWLEGNQTSAFAGPDKLVLSRSAAERYFPNGKALGKELVLIPVFGNEGAEVTFQVNGIVEDYPANSHLSFEFLVSYESFNLLHGEDKGYRGWRNLSAYNYVRLNDIADEEKVNKHINQVVEKHISEKDRWYEHYLQPMADIHLNTRNTPLNSKGSLQRIYVFALIAILVLIIACINFMNLTTARASARAREIGVRTVLGAQRKQLFFQFMSEAFVYTATASVLAWVFVDISVPLFNQVFDTNLDTYLLTDPLNWLYLVIFTIILGLIAGSYPAIYLSGMGPKLVKGNKNQTQTGSIQLRKVLVTLQFIASIVLIIGTLVITQQMRFIQQKELGFNEEMVMHIPLYGTEQREAYQNWKAELSRIPGVLAISSTNTELGQDLNGNGISIDTTKDHYMLNVLSVDADYREVMELELIEGRWFDGQKPTDLLSGFVVNEAAVEFFGWTPSSAIGKFLSRNSQEGVIIGVAKDFHFESLHESMKPLIMYAGKDGWEHSKLVLKLSGHNIDQTLTQLESIWNELESKRAFTYTFMDESLAELYKADRQFGQIFGAFSLLAILIACLGLLGLVAFAAAMRSKEIGIRKVLGATIRDILLLLGKDFTKLLAIAFVIAIPIAWYTMAEWLKSFAYRTPIGPEIFVLAAMITLTIALLTMGWHAYRAASLNPAEILKDE